MSYSKELLNRGVIVSEEFDGYCQSVMQDGVVAYSGGLSWEEYKAIKLENSGLVVKLISENEFEILLEKHHKKTYLDVPPKLITAARYDEMLCVLPPENWCEAEGVYQFRMCEYQTHNITTQFGKVGGVYLEKYIDIKDRSTWLKVSDFLEVEKCI